MCTAIKFDERFFGRTLDFEHSFGEELIVTPRDRMHIGESVNRYAIMGIGVKNGHTPLYFDGVNEWGLASAALNFPGCAVYHSIGEGKRGVSSAHLISLILGFCRSVSEARDMLGNIFISDEGADKSIPPTLLHWIVADSREAIVVESVSEGLRIYDDPIGVLTNSPDFPYQLTRLSDYPSLTAKNPESTAFDLPLYSRGMGAIGLPGDFSSTSRFVRAGFVKENTITEESDTTGEISRLFHILGAVSVPPGCIVTDEGKAVSTIYTACADLEEPAYYLTTSSCRTIRKISLTDELSQANEISTHPIHRKEIILDL
jgi:choloylglycine hydrolase